MGKERFEVWPRDAGSGHSHVGEEISGSSTCRGSSGGGTFSGGRSEKEIFLWLSLFFVFFRVGWGGVCFAKKMHVEFLERGLTTTILIAFWGASNDEKFSPFCLRCILGVPPAQ